MGQKHAKSANGSAPAEAQAAAICYRKVGDKYKVLLVTSLSSRRWIIPKGWPMDGLSLSESAAIEAHEEAGIIGAVGKKSIGHYRYTKERGRDEDVTCKVHVFPLKVKRIAKSYEEKGRRRRDWVSTKEAARRVKEPGLKRILSKFEPA